MSADTLLSFIKGIVTNLGTELEPLGVKDVQTHYGMFNDAAVERFAADAPAARVAAIGISEVEPFEGQLEAKVRFAIYLITTDGYLLNTTPPTPVARDVAMLGLVQAVIQLANQNSWGGEAGDQPEDIVAENLYSDGEAGKGYLLWAVSFTQGVNCDVTDITTLDPFTTLTQSIEDPDNADQVVIADDGPVNQ